MLEMLLFGLVSALVVILLMPADVQARIRRAVVSSARRFADVVERGHARTATKSSEPQGAIREVSSPWSKTTVVSVERVFDSEGMFNMLNQRIVELESTNRRLNGFIADYVGDMKDIRWELSRIKGRIDNISRTGNEYGIDTDSDGAIDIQDQATELRSMVYVQDSVTGAVDQVPVKRRGRPRKQ